MSRSTLFFGITCKAGDDGFPIKSLLPEELRKEFQTRNQWAECGCCIYKGAKVYKMHPSERYYDLREYYHKDDVFRMMHSAAMQTPRYRVQHISVASWDPSVPYIAGLKLSALSNDGLPLRGALDESLAGKFETLNHWVRKGKVPKPGAKSYQMHCGKYGGKIYPYIYEGDVEDINEHNDPYTCLSCKNRNADGTCGLHGNADRRRSICKDWESLFGFARENLDQYRYDLDMFELKRSAIPQSDSPSCSDSFSDSMFDDISSHSSLSEEDLNDLGLNPHEFDF